MVRLRKKCGTKLCTPNVEQLGISRSITICFQNCKSLLKHIEDVRKDRYITKADILGLCETRVLQNKQLYNLDMYNSFLFFFEKCPHGAGAL